MKVSSLVLSASLMLAGLGCHSLPKSLDIYSSPSFSDHEQVLIIKSVEKWETVIPIILKFHIEDHDCNNTENSICIVPSTYLKLNADNNIKFAIGNCQNDLWSDTAYITIATDTLKYNPREYQWVIMHELGHAFGLDHDVNNTLMTYDYNDASINITCLDIKQFNALRGIKWSCL